MTRAEVLAQYRPIRAGIRRVLSEATKACGRADLNRGIKQVAPWAEAEALEEEVTAEMLVDVALFEPNQRGRRAFDRFLAEKGRHLTGVDRALAERMVGARFSIFRVAERHEAAGLWLEDLLAGQRRVWLVDEALEVSASEDAVIGLRLFDAGPFHAGFGIIVAPDAETLDFCLAATLYGDQLRANAPPGPADLALLEMLTDMLISSPAALTMPGTKKARRQPSSNPRNTPQPRKRR